ncbi:MAG: 2,3-bisphosphoglycerate-independent phosphoglycerate mutase [Flavobacteriales bacterium]|nr:2,3-bisphosphoglycerate-independent phosphoglycerate mutase [Flavobacteriales bacterium]
MKKKAGLIILDGWGIGAKDDSDGVFLAKTPFFDNLINQYPNAHLTTFGKEVGLPDGQMGNSEVGHLNIGAGRIVYQDLLRINNAIEDGSFFKNPQLLKAIQTATNNKSAIHLMGLVSEGGVHSSLDHLLSLCSFLKENFSGRVYIHGFSDGRDCGPTTGIESFEKLHRHIHNSNIVLSSIIGRYYAMDRDQRWERIKKAYDLLVDGTGEIKEDYSTAFKESYSNDITDEFLKPVKIKNNKGTIKDNDLVVCFNFRTDRCRQITTALTQNNFLEHGMKIKPLHFYTMTNYDRTFKNVEVIFDKDNLPMTLGEILSINNKKQLRIAETEKYPHVTYFFNGGREKEFNGEARIVVSSPKVATYDLQPEMSAENVTSSAIEFLKEKTPDFLCLNFANPDMVGHTGVPNAIVKACETVDNCLEKLVKCLIELDYSVIIIADHGNADRMKNKDGSAHTAHTVNMVPVIVLDRNVKVVENGKLADIAPSILKLMEIDKPKEMSGVSII